MRKDTPNVDDGPGIVPATANETGNWGIRMKYPLTMRRHWNRAHISYLNVACFDLGLEVHAAQKVREARVRAQRL